MDLKTSRRLERSRRMERMLVLGFIVMIAAIALTAWALAGDLQGFVDIGGERRAQLDVLRHDTLRSFAINVLLMTAIATVMGITIAAEARFVRHVSKQLLQEARHDSLTRLPNRSYLHEALDRGIAGAKRNGEKLALLYMDLNGFKAINDTYGHKAGDDVLVQAARWLQTTARGSDFVARVGGDEFAVLLPRLKNREEAVAAAERFGKLWVTREQHSVTASVGCAIFPDEARTADELLKLSDEQMYEQKQSARRKVN